ncbi:MAG: hypothetical protein M9962_09365 [Oligoflexia bacterium]|nr:hypothetical protein [Oligoflexia bacterium]
MKRKKALYLKVSLGTFLCLLLFYGCLKLSLSNKKFTQSDLEHLLANHPKTNKPVDSVEELVPLLPLELRENFTFVYDSRSPFRNSISTKFPRVVLFTKDTKMILTYTGDPNKPGYDLLEAMIFNDKESKFTLKAYALPALMRKGEAYMSNTTTCFKCHGEDPRPINDSYPLWPGFYGSIQDTFPLSLEHGIKELNAYKEFLEASSKHGVYKDLVFPKGSVVTPYVDPQKFQMDKKESAPNEIAFLTNTRFGIAINDLNRKRLFRKIRNSKNFEQRKYEYLAELLDCSDSKVSEEKVKEIEKEIKKENRERLIRMGVNPDDASQRMNDMQELKFVRNLAQVDWLANETKLGRKDWSMALEENSFSYFDGILSGIYEGKSYYVKEDFIYEFLEYLTQTEAEFKPFFKTYSNFSKYGYPFGKKVKFKEALKSCPLLLEKLNKQALSY